MPQLDGPASGGPLYTIAAILPPNEGFSPAAIGAIGLVVRRLALHDPPGTRTIVLGAPAAAPFATPPFHPVRLERVPLPRTLRYRWAINAALRTLRPDAVEVHNRPALALSLAQRHAVSLFLHNDPQAMRGSATAAARDRLRHLARVITVSPWVQARLLDGLPTPWPRPPAIVPNGLDLPLPPGGDRAPLILFAGRLVPEKGADAFVAACALALPRLPDWRAELIGARHLRPGGQPDGYARVLHAAAGRAGVPMPGHLPHEAVLDAMRRAAIVVVPSRWPEPFGLTALEAMASGAALISSPRGNLATLTGGAALLADPDNPQALADALVALASDPARRAALAAAGLARAQAYSMAAAIAALTDARRRPQE